MTRSDCIHILRNPYGHSREVQREAALLACDEIERLEDSYNNMRAWAELNGLDTVCKGDDPVAYKKCMELRSASAK